MAFVVTKALCMHFLVSSRPLLLSSHLLESAKVVCQNIISRPKTLVLSEQETTSPQPFPSGEERPTGLSIGQGRSSVTPA